jgi:hypothetical protein
MAVENSGDNLRKSRGQPVDEVLMTPGTWSVTAGATGATCVANGPESAAGGVMGVSGHRFPGAT